MLRTLRDLLSERKTLIILLFSATLLGCGGGGGGGGGMVGPPPPPPPPPPPVRSPQPVFFFAEDTTLMQSHLYRADDEGAAPLQLSATFTNPDGRILNFSVSPDRQRVAYFADAEVDEVTTLYIVPASGGAPTSVDLGFPAGTRIPVVVWSPDSTQIAYHANPLGRAPRGFPHNEVFVVNSDGSDNRKVSGSIGNPPVVALGTLRWSPDGRYLAQGVLSLDPFQTLVGINTYDSNDAMQNSTRVTPALDWRNNERLQQDFFWLPDSSRLVFRSSHAGSANIQLYTVLPDGTDVTRINPDLVTDGDVTWASVSPDARTLIYGAQQLSTNFDVFASDVSGANNRRLTTSGNFTSAFLMRVDWSPDSSQITYSWAADTPNALESYVTNVDGSGTLKLHADLPPDQFANGATWSPDGTRVAFISDLNDTDLWEAFVVDADGGNLTSVSAVTVPTSQAFLPIEWSPDGQHVAYRARSGADDQLELYRSAADGSAGNRLNADLAADGDIDFSFSWSDDSTRIVFVDEIDDPISGFDTPEGVWAGTLDGAAPLRLNGTTDFGFAGFVY